MASLLRTCTADAKSTSLNSTEKNEKTRAESAFHKHLVTAHGERDPEKKFSDYFKVEILKAYKKP